MKITWNEYDTIRKIKRYSNSKFSEYPDNKKDFYNFITGEVSCGECHKKMRPFKALFHFHFN